MNDDETNLFPTDVYIPSSVNSLSIVSSEQDDLKSSTVVKYSVILISN